MGKKKKDKVTTSCSTSSDWLVIQMNGDLKFEVEKLIDKAYQRGYDDARAAEIGHDRDDDIIVGDEIIGPNMLIRGTVVCCDEEGNCAILTDDGLITFVKDIDSWNKTGRHFEHVNDLIKQMREGWDE